MTALLRILAATAQYDAQPAADAAHALAAVQAADLTRCQSMVDRLPHGAPLSLEELAIAACMDITPTDGEIIDVLVETFGMTYRETIERLVCMDLVALRREVATA